MSGDSAPFNLTNHFLIAMPGFDDPMFGRSVVLICEHTERGALGLVINKPADLALPGLFEKIDLPWNRSDLAGQAVFQGGPVQTERGFVLHEPLAIAGQAQEALGYASTMSISDGLAMTTSKDVLAAISDGGGPRRVLVSMGYSAWDQGQLEAEIAANNWLTVPVDPALIFDIPVAQRYDKALGLLGLESWMISHQVGHA